MLAYPIVLTVLFGLISVTGIVLLWINRENPYIRFRNPYFLIIENFGILLITTIITLYISLRPHFDCKLYTITNYLAFSLVAYPIVIRVWLYSMSYHASVLRSKVNKDGELPSNLAEVSWLFKHRWITNYNFLVKFYHCTFWIWLVPIVPQFYSQRHSDGQNIAAGACAVYRPALYVAGFFVISLVAFGFFSAKLIWGFRDTYRIKTEINLISFTWLTVICIYLPYTTVQNAHIQQVFPSGLLNLIGLYAVFSYSTIFPLYLTYAKTQPTVNSSLVESGFKEFTEQLEYPPFRNAFHDYLVKQLCQENLLFYEVVTQWKRLANDNPKRRAQCIAIFQDYILDTGVCPINVEYATRQKIIALMNKVINDETQEIPDGLFDKALSVVMNMMHNNSYHQFENSKLSVRV